MLAMHVRAYYTILLIPVAPFHYADININAHASLLQNPYNN